MFLIIFEVYKNELCEELKTCYNCTISNNNCYWTNNICSSLSSELVINNNIYNNTFLLQPFINYQYKCIKTKRDIEIFKELNNGTITLSVTSNTREKLPLTETINYHIYCLEYSSISNILILIRYNKSYINNIIHLSLYDNLTNAEKTINLINEYKLNIKSFFFCIKITYIIDNKIEDVISFQIIKINNNNIQNKNDNIIISYIILGGMILLITAIISLFIFWHKNKNGLIKEIIIMNKRNIYQKQNNETNESQENQTNNNNDDNDNDNDNDSEHNNDKSNCSELQEKYFQLEQNSFVSHNYETLFSFVKSIHDIEKKDKFLKTIIKTLPSFLIGINNSDLIGSICSFCENKIKLNDNVCLLNCGHIFHYDCIYQQIITNEGYQCMICKENIII